MTARSGVAIGDGEIVELDGVVVDVVVEGREVILGKLWQGASCEQVVNKL